MVEFEEVYGENGDLRSVWINPHQVESVTVYKSKYSKATTRIILTSGRDLWIVEAAQTVIDRLSGVEKS
jgi:uncharacterized protein YlzI (FlbEa/FlbD family)